jgi:hypothetical protein
MTELHWLIDAGNVMFFLAHGGKFASISHFDELRS